MSDLATVLQRPADLTDQTAAAWFDAIAHVLLNETHLLVGGEAHRLTEIEFYYHASIHPDPFAHRNPVQLHPGRWYFHRTRGTYRGGSFKGLDLTFGRAAGASPAEFGGVLFRSLFPPSPPGGEGRGEGAALATVSSSLSTPLPPGAKGEMMPPHPQPLSPGGARGEMIAGPSLLVDHLLKLSAAGDVASLDRAIGERKAWDPSSPLVLVSTEAPRLDRIFRTARVGLTLRQSKKGSEGLNYILRPYRYLTEPRGISKGKPHIVMALYMQGVGVEEIHRLTGSPRRSIERYIADFEAGTQEASFDRYFGKDLTPAELCRLHGTWRAKGRPAA
jgi:hypothetical protein